MIMDSLPVLVEITAVVLMENKVSRGAQHLHSISHQWSSLLKDDSCRNIVVPSNTVLKLTGGP